MQPFDPPTDEIPERSGPRLTAVVRHDSAAWAGAVLVAAFWTLHALVLLLVGDGSGGGLVAPDPSPALPLLATVIGGAVISARYTRIRAVLVGGQRARGEVSERAFHRGRGRLYVRFRVDGREVVTWAQVRDAGAVRALRVGEAVEVSYLVDRPEVAFVGALYR